MDVWTAGPVLVIFSGWRHDPHVRDVAAAFLVEHTDLGTAKVLRQTFFYIDESLPAARRLGPRLPRLCAFGQPDRPSCQVHLWRLTLGLLHPLIRAGVAESPI